MCVKSPILKPDFSLCSEFLYDDALFSEFKLWKKKWITYIDIDRSSGALKSLNYCNIFFFKC